MPPLFITACGRSIGSHEGVGTNLTDLVWCTVPPTSRTIYCLCGCFFDAFQSAQKKSKEIINKLQLVMKSGACLSCSFMSPLLRTGEGPWLPSIFPVEI
jgi:hypothetical protein